MPKGLNITYKPLNEDHVWAIMTWAEEDVGGGHLTIEVAVRNMKSRTETSGAAGVRRQGSRDPLRAGIRRPHGALRRVRPSSGQVTARRASEIVYGRANATLVRFGS